MQTGKFPYEWVPLVTVTIIDNKFDTKLIGETKRAGMKYKKVLKYYQEKDGNKAKIPEDKTCKLVMPYLYFEVVMKPRRYWKSFQLILIYVRAP